MYYKKNNKGQYWTGEDWTYSKALCRMYETFDEVCQTPKAGRIQMDKPPADDVFNCIKNLSSDSGLILKYWSKKEMWYEMQLGEIQIRVHWNKNNDGFSIRTRIDHPTQGKSELWRNYATLAHVKQILINPRAHTGLPTQRIR